MSETRELNVVVFGATGFVGRLICKYLAAYADRGTRWGIAGRGLAELERLRQDLALPESVPSIEADAGDAAALRRLAGRTDVVLSVVGPYQKFGSLLVEACVETGTGYVDLNGEPLWMREMIDRFGARAEATGARIVFSCGYDSIPFECGVGRLQERCAAAWGQPAERVAGRVLATKGGGFSGGTTASLKANRDAAAGDAGLGRLLDDPFALTPGFAGVEQPDMAGAHDDPLLGRWVGPHVMAVINTKNVHRSNMLLGHRYGCGFRYDEMRAAPGTGAEAKAAAEHMAASDPLERSGAKPGSQNQQPEDGFYRLAFIAERGGERLALLVTGDSNPGYGSTSKMIAQAAQCLAHDGPWPAGIWTPFALMEDRLVDRLEQQAGLAFTPADASALG